MKENKSPIQRYYEGEITAEEYLEIVLKEQGADHTLQEQEKKLEKIMKRYSHLAEAK